MRVEKAEEHESGEGGGGGRGGKEDERGLLTLIHALLLQAKSCLEKSVRLNWSFEKASLLLSHLYQKGKEHSKAVTL